MQDQEPHYPSEGQWQQLRLPAQESARLDLQLSYWFTGKSLSHHCKMPRGLSRPSIELEETPLRCTSLCLSAESH